MPKEKPFNRRYIKPQHQTEQTGIDSRMEPQSEAENPEYTASGKLKGKVALITGGDSEIGRAVAIFFTKEEADISLLYLNKNQDAAETKSKVEKEGRRCVIMPGDIREEQFCRETVQKTHDSFGRLDILVNNAAVQYPQKNLEDISSEQLQRTFQTNIFSFFYMTQSVLKYLPPGSSIINSTLVTAYRRSHHFIDYSSTKGATVSFTRSLALALIDRGIRVNAVAPGPIWTHLIPCNFPLEHVETFSTIEPPKRAGQPDEVAPSYLFLATNKVLSYMTGHVLHPNGGEIINV